MKALGLKIFAPAKALSGMQMEILIMACLKKGKRTGREYIPGKMVKFMMENGTKALSTGMVFGRALIMIVISENGTRAEQTGMEFTHGPMVTGTRVNGTSA